MKKRSIRREPGLPDGTALLVLFICAPFLVGLFYEWLSGAAAVYLLGYLIYCRHVRGGLRIPRSPVFLALSVTVMFYLLSAFWAVDRGMAPLGAVRFFPAVLFILALAQLESGFGQKLLSTIPPGGAVMVVLSLMVSHLPRIGGHFLVSGRQAGFFQYPNTYGLYLLLGIVLLLTRETISRLALLELAVLLLGIALSGSRTTLILLLVTAVLCLPVRNKTPLQKLLPGLLLIAAAIFGGYLAVTRNSDVLERYVNAFAASSTIWERLISYRDALPLILRHPFGLGYTGFAFIQTSVQTAVYSVRNVHNELLQLLLDVGWIPGGLVVYALGRSFAQADARRRLLLLVFVLHAMLDFDLQFLAMYFILLVIADSGAGRAWTIKNPVYVISGAAAAGSVCLYFGIASFLYYIGENSMCAALYPGYTYAWIAMLPEAETVEEMDAYADQILSRNSYVSLAYSAKARTAYSEGDFAAMIRYKKAAIRNARYRLEEYLDYFDMLYIGIQLYENAGDSYSADYCRECLQEIPEMMEEVLEDTDPRAYGLPTPPELELPEEYREKLGRI